MKFLYIRCDNCPADMPGFHYCFVEAPNDSVAYTLGFQTLKESDPVDFENGWFIVNDLAVALAEDVPVHAVACISACDGFLTENLTPHMLMKLQNEVSALHANAAHLKLRSPHKDLRARLEEAWQEISDLQQPENQPWLEETALLLERMAPVEQKIEPEPQFMSFWTARAQR